MSQIMPEVVSFNRKKLTLTCEGKPRCVVHMRSTLEVYKHEEHEGKEGHDLEKPSKVKYERRCARPAQGTVNAIDEALRHIDEKLQSERLTNIANKKSETEHLRDIAKLCLCGEHKNVIEAAVTQWEEERQHRYPTMPGAWPTTPESPRSKSPTPTPAPLPRTPTKQTAPQDPFPNIKNAAPLSSYGSLLWKDLGCTDRKSGWLYVFSIENLKGYYKLGHTTVSIAEARNRFRSHGYCYGSINVVALIEINNVARYEQLIFKSLSHCQRIFGCPGVHNNAKHREWLQIDKQSLLEKIYSWQRLSVAGLYSRDGKPNPKFLQPTTPESPSLVDEVLAEYHHSRLATPQSKSRSVNDLSSRFAKTSLGDDDDEDEDDAIGQSSPSVRKQKDTKSTTSRRHSAQPIVKEELVY